MSPLLIELLEVNRLQDETKFRCVITSVDSPPLMAEQGVYIQKVLALIRV